MLCHENIFKKFIAQFNVEQKFILNFITKSKKMIYEVCPKSIRPAFISLRQSARAASARYERNQ